MNMTRSLAAMGAALLLSSFSASGQYVYKFLFRGTSYTTNGAGDIVATPITEQTLLADRAGGAVHYTMEFAYFAGFCAPADHPQIIGTST